VTRMSVSRSAAGKGRREYKTYWFLWLGRAQRLPQLGTPGNR
jgi:hypothetical protein